MSANASAMRRSTHLCPDISVVGSQDSYTRSSFAGRHLLDLFERLSKLRGRFTLRVELEVTIICQDNNVVVLVRVVRQWDIGGRGGHPDGVEPEVSGSRAEPSRVELLSALLASMSRTVVLAKPEQKLAPAFRLDALHSMTSSS